MHIKKPSLKGVAHTGHLGHFAQDKHIQRGHNDVVNPPGTMKMIEHMMGGANRKMTIDETVDLINPKTKDEINQEKLQKSYEKDSSAKTLDEKFMRMMQRKKMDNTG